MDLVSSYPVTSAMTAITFFIGIRSEHQSIKRYISTLGLTVANGIVFGQITDGLQGAHKCVPMALALLVIGLAGKGPENASSGEMTSGVLLFTNILSFIYANS